MSPRKSLIKSIDPKRFPKLFSEERLSALLSTFKSKKILVVGDVGVDRYTIGAVERISPEAPVPIVRVKVEQHKLGLAANVADNVRALGGEALLTGVVGRDSSAADFKKLLKSAKISAEFLITDPSRRTILKERIVSDRQQLLRVDYESLHETSKAVESKLHKQIQNLISEADAVIVEDYAKGLLNPKLTRMIFERAKRARKLVTVDPNVKTPMDFYVGAAILTPNTREAEGLSKIAIRNDQSLCEAGKKILRQTGAKYVIITRGKEGMAIFSSRGGPVLSIPTYAREVYDVSGAGDTVIAVLTLALASGASVEEAAVLGNLAAGVEVGKRGTATVSPQEIIDSLRFYNNFAKSV